MASETNIVNVALGLIGATPITSFNDGSASANIANDIYEELRDNLLRSHPWNFGTKRQKLAQSSTLPAFEFDFAYPLPADWIRTVSIHNNDAGHGTLLYRMEVIADQRAIVTSSDEVFMRYIFQVKDPNLMAADFRRALSVSLARDMAVKLASSNTLQDQLSKQAKTALASARSKDAMGAFPELRPRGSWASSRGGGRQNDNFLND